MRGTVYGASCRGYLESQVDTFAMCLWPKQNELLKASSVVTSNALQCQVDSCCRVCFLVHLSLQLGCEINFVSNTCVFCGTHIFAVGVRVHFFVITTMGHYS